MGLTERLIQVVQRMILLRRPAADMERLARIEAYLFRRLAREV